MIRQFAVLALCLAVLSSQSLAVSVDLRHRDELTLFAAPAPPSHATTPPKPSPHSAATNSSNATRHVHHPHELVRSSRPTADPLGHPVYFNGRLRTRVMRAANLTVRQGGYCLVVNKLSSKNRVRATKLHAGTYTTDYITVETIKPWPHHKIKFQANLEVKGAIIHGLPPTKLPPPEEVLGKLQAPTKHTPASATAFLEELSLLSHVRPSLHSAGPRHAITHGYDDEEEQQEFDSHIGLARNQYVPQPNSPDHRQYTRQWTLLEHDDFEGPSTDSQMYHRNAADDVPDGHRMYHGAEIEDEEDEEDYRDLDEADAQRMAARRRQQMEERGRAIQEVNDDLEAQRKVLAGWIWNDGTSALENRSHCGDRDQFLHANGAISAPNQPDISPSTVSVSKVFRHLPPHSQLSLQAQVHFIDEWRGAVVYALIDGEHVWLDSHDSIMGELQDFGGEHPSRDRPSETLDPTGANLCGGAHPWDRLSVPIKVVVPHVASSVNITFGCSSLLPGSSFGVDDVSVLIR